MFKNVDGDFMPDDKVLTKLPQITVQATIRRRKTGKHKGKTYFVYYVTLEPYIMDLLDLEPGDDIILTIRRKEPGEQGTEKTLHLKIDKGEYKIEED